MRSLTLHTPEGVRDIYNSEYERKLDTLYTLRKSISKFGYMPISTPTFEYFDTFSKEVGSCSANEMYKFIYREGNTLVLRPDITPSVARAAAMYFSECETPVRLSYEGNVFRNYHSLQGRLKESTQVGGEFIGVSTPEADAEILTIVVNNLKAVGLKNFEIGVGHVDIIKGLIEETKLDDEGMDNLTKLIANKNFFGAVDIVKNSVNDSNLIKLFEFAGKILDNPSEWQECLEYAKPFEKVYNALDYLTKLYAILKENQVTDYISFEFGMLSEYKYYTGIIFAGYTYGTGEPIVKGGRYDSLLAQFGKDAAAIGFAIMVDQLMFALERQ